MSNDDFNSIDEFLSHRSNESSKSNLLGKWKKDPGYIDVWLHTKRIPKPVWVHSFPVKKTWTDKLTGEEVTRYFPEKFVCHESDRFLKDFHRELATGKNSVVPEKCPVCKFIHHVRTQIARGKLAWTDVLYEFVEDRDALVLHAGGIYGAFNRAKDDKEAQADLRKHGIFLKDAWKETLLAKCNYVLSLVPEENPSVVVTVEPSLLGDKVKECIATTMEALGTEDGNPFLNPWCIRLKYNEKETEFSKKYSAIRMAKVALSSEVESLIFGDAPSIDSQTRPFNTNKMRLLMEEACKVQIDFDVIFGEEHEKKSASKIKEPASTSMKAAPVASPSRRAKKAPVVEEIPCEDCQAPMLITDSVCKKCGAEYEVGEPARPTSKATPSKMKDEDEDDLPF